MAEESSSSTIESSDIASDVAHLQRFGFRLELIRPADDPTVAELAGHGIRLRLEKGPTHEHGADQPSPEAAYTVSRATDAYFGKGRAGMTYRDLIPGRCGGRFIASHIRIDVGGPVGDYVHFHDIDFQIIYCAAGWVDVVYEDQGPPFRLSPGDCVIQPPLIRHRVLEASPGLEVIEIGSPASHDTRVDHDMTLPTRDLVPDRMFGPQKFIRHVASRAEWVQSGFDGFEVRDTGIGIASAGAGSVEVYRPQPGRQEFRCGNGGDLRFGFILVGSARLRLMDEVGTDSAQDTSDSGLENGDAFTVAGGRSFSLGDCSEDLRFLLVRSPVQEMTNPS